MLIAINVNHDIDRRGDMHYVVLYSRTSELVLANFELFSYCIVYSEQFSLSLEHGKLVWRKEGGKARLRLAELQLHSVPPSTIQVQIIQLAAGFQ
jgi:hypothetical protein